MLGDGKVGRKNPDKDRRNGSVYLNTDEIDSGKYLLEVYNNGVMGPLVHGHIVQ